LKAWRPGTLRGVPDDRDPPVPAPLGRRSAAGLLDCAVISVVFVLFIEAAAGGDDDFIGGVLPSTFWFLALHAYYFLPELFWDGRSFGKWAFGLRVTMLDGRPNDPYAILIRTLLRLIDFVPGLYLGGLLVCWITGPRKRQRLGDLAAGTTVVVAPRASR
jgi:uncharacterized RDD family membrane protein YckC